MILDVDYPRGQSTSFLLHISLSRSRPKGVKGQRHEYPRVKGIARYLRLFMSLRIAHIFYGFYIASLSG